MRETQYSVMNDESYKDFGVLMISEPYNYKDEQRRWQAGPQRHSVWCPVIPNRREEEERFRAMVWVHKDVPTRRSRPTHLMWRR
jgi:hypothetical protein